MITNEKQFRSTRSLLEKLRASLDAIKESAPANIHPMFVEAQRSALVSQITEMEEDVVLYEGLKSGRVKVFEAKSLSDLPDILIQARIARGMSQKDLAEFLGLREQQVQRYEADRYRSASLDRLIDVADALSIKLHEKGTLQSNERLDPSETTSYNSYPIAEMFKRGWFEGFNGNVAQARKSADIIVPAFLRSAHNPLVTHAMYRRSVRSKVLVHQAAMAAWQARILILADRNPPKNGFDPSAVTNGWLNQLTRFSADEDGLRKVRSSLNDVGISLVVEPHLPGTLLDGAAMCSAKGAAVIGLTLRHDRWDNFWFTLMHEIAHLVLHISSNKFEAIFDDVDVPANSAVEKEADRFAQEALLPEEQWSVSLSRYTRTEKAVLSDAARFHISPSIIAGRIRREAQDYTILRNLVGTGEVRKRFQSEA